MTKLDEGLDDRRGRNGWGDDWHTPESARRRARAVMDKITAEEVRDGTVARLRRFFATPRGRDLLERWNRERAEVGRPPLEER